MQNICNIDNSDINKMPYISLTSCQCLHITSRKVFSCFPTTTEHKETKQKTYANCFTNEAAISWEGQTPQHILLSSAKDTSATDGVAQKALIVIFLLIFQSWSRKSHRLRCSDIRAFWPANVTDEPPMSQSNGWGRSTYNNICLKLSCCSFKTLLHLEKKLTRSLSVPT